MGEIRLHGLCAIVACLTLVAASCSSGEGLPSNNAQLGSSTTEVTTTTDEASESATTAVDSTAPGTGSGTPAESPNILILIADDMGVESSPCFDGAAPAPNLEAACANGVVFDQAWSSPVCSPTRAGVLTGRHSFRTGVGTLVNSRSNGQALSTDEVTLPRALDLADTGYATASFGKWHLGGDENAPNELGWDHFSGVLSGGIRSYFNWSEVTNGTTTQHEDYYATTANVDGARDWIEAQDGPWLTWIGFNAPHTPFHVPPEDLHSFDLVDDGAAIDANPLPYYQASIEAMDSEIGRLLEVVDLDNTVVIFMGDNGTPLAVSSFARGEAKGSLQEGGVHVPMFAWGAGVESGVRSDALVGTIDVFATALDLAGVDLGSPDVGLPVIDSISFAGVLDGSSSGERTLMLSEHFGADVRDNQGGATIRDEQYKLTSLSNGSLFLSDLVADPNGETRIGSNEGTAEERAAFERLSAALNGWTSDPSAPAPS